MKEWHWIVMDTQMQRTVVMLAEDGKAAVDRYHQRATELQQESGGQGEVYGP